VANLIPIADLEAVIDEEARDVDTTYFHLVGKTATGRPFELTIEAKEFGDLALRKRLTARAGR
jgi:hypothetical protein